MPYQPIKKALNKAFLKVKPNRSQIETFKTNLTHLLDQVNEGESEEFHKNLVSAFLKNTYYGTDYAINTKDKTDLVIHTGKTAKNNVGVLIEAKSPTNKAEMPTREKLNSKAFQELLLYYFRERVTGENKEIKNLIITNINQWFIFDSQQFEKHFYSDKKLVKHFKEFEEKRLSGTKTDFFYKDIASPAIEAVRDKLEFTWFKLDTYLKPLKNDDPKDDNKLIALFKVFSPEHLLKLPFSNDSNSLNRTFYSELLHIIGLTEEKEGGKKIIQRLPIGKRNPASLIENAIDQLESKDHILQLDNPKEFGSNHQERVFNVALELVITWVNRILFLKLLEAQLLGYHKGNPQYSFLNSKTIQDYDQLDDLFFKVLAKGINERTEAIAEKFYHVPYLNSSLFESTYLEHKTIWINNLSNGLNLPVLTGTVLKNSSGKKLTGERETLQYLFDFLSAYDFSSEGGEEIQEENKTLINASVLGLIFEKINGYKDGSFFTPGFITMYMCQEAIRRAVLQKFNDVKGWNCKDLTDLHNSLGNSREEKKEANTIINSLKICDPAVGSGHFLVSALNEILAIKSELGLLMDKEGKVLRDYEVKVENDELIVAIVDDDEPKLFEYHPSSKESQRVQETLFHEKQTIIENCLFGVDINPNSVKICRLRLWIELLKNAYYKGGAGSRELETLPNIDINIKTGNSLVSRFALDANLKKALKKSKWNIDTYRIAVTTYHHANSKAQKREMEKLITDIKGDFTSEISANDPKLKRLYKVEGEVTKLLTQQQMFEMSKKEKTAFNKQMKRLSEEAGKLRLHIEEIKSNAIYDNAFEWRFEFPEVLDTDGNFIGFDVVIANPPYIRQEELAAIKPYLEQHYKTYAGTADLYVFFVELGLNLMRPNAQFIYILPNKWMRAGYGNKLRSYLQSQNIESIIDFGDLPVFEEATTYPCIMRIEKATSNHRFESAMVETLTYTNGLTAYLKERAFEVDSQLLQPSGWTLSDVKVQRLLEKLKNTGVPLGEYLEGKIYYGIKTGLNEAFVIDQETRDKLIKQDPSSAEIIKPFLAGRDIKRYKQPESDKYLIFTRRRIDIECYPAIHKYLLKYKERLMPKPKGFTGKNWPGRKAGTYKWYEIQDAVDYYEEFEKEKIMLPDIANRCQATIDKGGYYCVNTAYILPGLGEFELGLLNSSLILFYYASLTQTIRGGYYRFIKQYLEQLPIALCSLVQKDAIADKVKELLSGNQKAEAEIDKLVYELYGLSEEEIRIIERT